MDDLQSLLDESFREEEIMESEEAFLVLALMVRSGRTLDQLVGGSGLDRAGVEEVLSMATSVGLVRASTTAPLRFSIDWKPFTRYFLEEAVGLDTEISVMVQAHQGDDDEAFEDFAARANALVNEFTGDLSKNPRFTDLVRDYLRLLVEEFLADDPRLYDMTLADAARAFESLLVKIGPGSFKTRSKDNARLLRSIRAWAQHASEVNMLGEVALAQVMHDHGLLR